MKTLEFPVRITVPDNWSEDPTEGLRSFIVAALNEWFVPGSSCSAFNVAKIEVLLPGCAVE